MSSSQYNPYHSHHSQSKIKIEKYSACTEFPAKSVSIFPHLFHWNPGVVHSSFVSPTSNHFVTKRLEIFCRGRRPGDCDKKKLIIKMINGSQVIRIQTNNTSNIQSKPHQSSSFHRNIQFFTFKINGLILVSIHFLTWILQCSFNSFCLKLGCAEASDRKLKLKVS